MTSPTINAQQDALLARLKAGFPKPAIEAFPDDPQSYVLKSQQGAILVRYDGREWSDPDVALPRHVTVVRFELVVIKKNLRRHGAQEGVQEDVDAITRYVEGHEHEGFCYFATGDGFAELVQGEWRYAIQVEGRRKLQLEVPS